MAKAKRDIYQEVTDSIIAKLEEGVAPWAKSWSGGGFALPRRSTGQHYRGINVLLLLSTGQTGEHWFTYKQAAASGGQVRKGEKGTTVIFYKQLRIKQDDGSDKGIPLLRSFTVFNQDQIDGLPARFDPAPVEAINPDERQPAIEAYIAATGATITHGGDRAFYAPVEDRIQLPEWSQFVDGVAYYGTALHELAHWTGHKTRLDRLTSMREAFSTKRDSTAYATEELVAELSASFLGASLGVETELREDHVSYLQVWLSALKADKKAIFKAATKAQAAVDFLDGLQPQALEEAA
jgi:antirestriction protein ArdC